MGNSSFIAGDGCCYGERQLGGYFYYIVIYHKIATWPTRPETPGGHIFPLQDTGPSTEYTNDTKLSEDSGGADSLAGYRPMHNLFRQISATNMTLYFTIVFSHPPFGHACDSQEEIINFIFLLYIPLMHFPIIHPFTTPFFIYSFFPLSVLSFEIFIYNYTPNINHYIRRHIMPAGAVILNLTNSDVFKKKKKT